MASNPDPDADMASIPEPNAVPEPVADLASNPKPSADEASNQEPGAAEASNPPKDKRDRSGRKRSCCVPGCIPSGFVHHKIPANNRAQWLVYVLIT